ncbi:hypothetical protein G6F22_019433 [Rhizopus arrhizus]|nr:hypothetical protein G6F22_019433 [Rhizopus arrhizus]
MRVAGEQRPFVGEAIDHAQLRRDAGLGQLGHRHAGIVFGKDVVHLRLQLVAVNAHARHQRQLAAGHAHLILRVEAQLGGLADREIAHRECIGQDGGAGLAVGQHLETIALLADLGACALEAVGRTRAGRR